MSVENPEVTAIILAGGKSQRMGSNKALLKYGDTTFIERQIARLSKIFQEIILSANDTSIYAHLLLPVVPDVIPGKGPLSGICAGIMHATNHYTFAVACDMPFISEEVILYLKQFITDYDVVVPRTERGLEPLHAFYSKNCIPPMQQCLKEGRLRVIDFFSEVKVKIVNEEELRVLAPAIQPLINLNTPEEYNTYCKIPSQSLNKN